ncbi:MAG: DUF364 domain-containing protein [Nitrososphaerales archaeon]
MTIQRRIVDRLLSCLRRELPDVDTIRADKVYLGLGFTAVRLSSGHVGLCHSLQSEVPLGCCQIVRRAGTMAGSSAMNLAGLIKSWDMGQRVVGAATINALSQIVLESPSEKYVVEEGNLIDHIDVKQDDTVSLVGNIRPIVSTIRSKARKLYIFERGRIIDEGVLPDTACEELLPQSDIVIITGTAIANGTIDRILELSRESRYIALIGPSATVIPDPLFDCGVSAIAGVIVVDPEKAMQIVAEGGGTPQLKTAVKFVVIKPK